LLEEFQNLDTDNESRRDRKHSGMIEIRFCRENGRKSRDKLVENRTPPWYTFYIKKGGDRMKLGDHLFQARKKSGLSQEEVAEKLGVSRQTISKWETEISHT